MAMDPAQVYRHDCSCEAGHADPTKNREKEHTKVTLPIVDGDERHLRWEHAEHVLTRRRKASTESAHRQRPSINESHIRFC